MLRRTTIELDPDLVTRAAKVLNTSTTRATVEAALLLAAEQGEAAAEERAKVQAAFLARLSGHVDVDVLASEEMWR